MATVHPSRLGLVPQDPLPHTDSRRDTERRSRDDHRRRGSRDRDDRSSRRDNDRDQDERRRERSRSRDRNGRSNGREADGDERRRRASPDYGAYRREEPPHADSSAQGKADRQQNMYASRGERRVEAGFANGRDSNSDFLMNRRKQREAMNYCIWPSSPVHSREVSRERGSKRKRSDKRRRSPSITDSSEEERERRRRKEKKKQREKGKDRDEGRDKRSGKERRDKSYDDKSGDDRRHHRRRSRSYRSRDDSEDERGRKKHSRNESDSEDARRRRRSRSTRSVKDEKEPAKSRHRSRADTPPRSSEADDEDMWIEKAPEAFVAVAEHAKDPSGAERRQTTNGTGQNAVAAPIDDDDDAEEVGPQPAPAANTTNKKTDEREYGGALLRGEGSAMAAFLLEGGTEARIPRRGEIGLASDEIAAYEAVGYVMSGNRHKRMNAVRMRKENQVISAEEKRGILKLQKEENERREAILREEFRELVDEKLKTAGAGPRPPS